MIISYYPQIVSSYTLNQRVKVIRVKSRMKDLNLTETSKKCIDRHQTIQINKLIPYLLVLLSFHPKILHKLQIKLGSLSQITAAQEK